MPHGRWVAFEGDGAHDCSAPPATKPAPKIKSSHAPVSSGKDATPFTPHYPSVSEPQAPLRDPQPTEPQKQKSAEPAISPSRIKFPKADYYPIISRAVAGLERNTAESRGRLYDRARAAQSKQLQMLDPTMKSSEYFREHSSLEKAIKRVETENTETDISTAPKPHQPTSAQQSDFHPKRNGRALSTVLTAASGIIIFALFAAIPTLFVIGGIWAAPKALKYLELPVDIAFSLCLFVFLPLSVFQKTRLASAFGFVASSFIFGACTWFAGLLTSYGYFGLFWTVIALFFIGVGVVPLGIIGEIWHGQWIAAAFLCAGVALTYATRIAGFWVAERSS